jgi:hypothetical protein
VFSQKHLGEHRCEGPPTDQKGYKNVDLSTEMSTTLGSSASLSRAKSGRCSERPKKLSIRPFEGDDCRTNELGRRRKRVKLVEQKTGEGPFRVFRPAHKRKVLVSAGAFLDMEALFNSPTEAKKMDFEPVAEPIETRIGDHLDEGDRLFQELLNNERADCDPFSGDSPKLGNTPFFLDDLGEPTAAARLQVDDSPTDLFFGSPKGFSLCDQEGGDLDIFF